MPAAATSGFGFVFDLLAVVTGIQDGSKERKKSLTKGVAKVEKTFLICYLFFIGSFDL